MPRRALADKRPLLLASNVTALAFYYWRWGPWQRRYYQYYDRSYYGGSYPSYSYTYRPAPAVGQTAALGVRLNRISPRRLNLGGRSGQSNGTSRPVARRRDRGRQRPSHREPIGRHRASGPTSSR